MVVKTSANNSKDLGSIPTMKTNLTLLRNILLIKLPLHFLRFKIFSWTLAFLALIVAAQCALNSSKAQLRFAYCALVLQIAFCFCGATFLMLGAQLCLEPMAIVMVARRPRRSTNSIDGAIHRGESLVSRQMNTNKRCQSVGNEVLKPPSRRQLELECAVGCRGSVAPKAPAPYRVNVYI